jgi:hypothetical protein
MAFCDVIKKDGLAKSHFPTQRRKDAKVFIPLSQSVILAP